MAVIFPYTSSRNSSSKSSYTVVGKYFSQKSVVKPFQVKVDTSTVRLVLFHQSIASSFKKNVAIILFSISEHTIISNSFISDIRSNAETSGLVQLQKKLISRVFGREIDVGDVHEGDTKIKSFLSRKKVLLVLDDVNHSDQLGYLAGREDWFGSGSIIIITTRDAHLLIDHGVERRRDPSVWESQLAKLRKVSNADIFKKLKISYDDLDDNEKQIFLDLAYLYVGGLGKDIATKLLDTCGFHATVGIQVLVDRSLLTISNAGTVEMHDLLREMGVQIVRQESAKEPGKRSRLQLTKDVIDVLGRNTGTEAVEGIALYNSIAKLHLSQYSFSVMKNLRLLILKCAPVHLSDGLKYLPIHAKRQLPPMFTENYCHGIIDTMKVDGQESEFIEYRFDHIRALSDHLCFRTTAMIPLQCLHALGQGLVVKKFGARLVYEQDVAELNQSNGDISDVAEVNESDTGIFYDALKVLPCDSGEAAAVSHTISKRGPSSGGAFSFYKEPQPDLLETLRTGRVQTPLPSTYLSDLIKLYPKRGVGGWTRIWQK
ncbi:TMV resistance protein N-like [Argentina anserina]|uniref:TMV resistance protein N-like n=1 Tax=Argentina anserina TaxID=57926 RepID=UPI002176716E|nr:TMV resistance protein N-like [Potentilla anserina]